VSVIEDVDERERVAFRLRQIVNRSGDSFVDSLRLGVTRALLPVRGRPNRRRPALRFW